MTNRDQLAEQNVIGCCANLDSTCAALDEVFDRLGPEHFADPNARDVFCAMSSTYSRYQSCSIVALSEAGYGAMVPYVSDMARNAVQSAMTRSIAILERLLKVRQLENLSSKITQILSSGAPADQKLEEVQGLIAVADTDTGTTLNARHISDVAMDWLDDVQAMYENRDKYICPTGIPDLDGMLDGGMVTNGLVVVGARPKVGKTEFLCKLIAHQGFDRKKPVLVASLEMTAVQNVNRIISNMAKVSRKSIRKGIDHNETRRLQLAIDDCSDAPIFINDKGNQSVAEIRAEARAIKAKHGEVGMVAIDYLGLMDLQSNSGRYDLDVGAATRSLKNLAKELNCPVVLLSQLSRKIEDRPKGSRPQNSDLINSGSIEADADHIFMLHWEGQKDPNCEFPTVREIICTANRHGDIGTVYQDMTEFGFANFDSERIVEAMERKQAEMKEPRRYAKDDKGF